MAVNMDVLLQSPIFDFWAVPVTFIPVKSQPNTASYQGRGIPNTYEIDVAALDGSIYSDQRTILDIRESEFAVLPLQGDRVVIPRDCNGVNLGEWQIIELKLHKYETIM
jgi:hypothetical protein